MLNCSSIVFNLRENQLRKVNKSKLKWFKDGVSENWNLFWLQPKPVAFLNKERFQMQVCDWVVCNTTCGILRWESNSLRSQPAWNESKHVPWANRRGKFRIDPCVHSTISGQKRRWHWKKHNSERESRRSRQTPQKEVVKRHGIKKLSLPQNRPDCRKTHGLSAEGHRLGFQAAEAYNRAHSISWEQNICFDMDLCWRWSSKKQRCAEARGIWTNHATLN